MGRKKYSKELKSTEIVFFCNLHHSEHAVMKKITPQTFRGTFPAGTTHKVQRFACVDT